jgi:hypothetical protein
MYLAALTVCYLMTRIGIVIGTGPSLADVADEVRQLKADGKVVLYGMNNTYQDFDLDVLICCDPDFHAHYGRIEGDFIHYHWDRAICDKYGYKYIEGRWADGVSPVGSNWISFNHGSGPQALNLATLHCDKVLLVGHDMSYPEGKPRHYFKGGEYPPNLRKYSKFEKPQREGGAHPNGDGILYNYLHIAEQNGLPPIINCTPNSAMKWFPIMTLSEAIDN